jgi:hypothetical protein
MSDDMMPLGWDNSYEPEHDSRNFEWVKSYPQFDERPASIIEFLGKGYLDIEDKIRPGVRAALIDIFGETVSPNVVSRVRRGMFTGSIGSGKTTLASIAIPYCVHWTYCLSDPQDFFNLLDGSRIAFMLMSTTDTHAKEVLFTDIKARISSSPWFQAKCLPDPGYKNELRFPKELWVIPGNSQETTFEGWNILCGIIDEGDSHKVTEAKDYASAAWDTIHSRIASRFSDPESNEHRGLLMAIGQMKSVSGFMAAKMDELLKDELASVTKLALWESYGWEYYRDKKTGKYDIFYYDIQRKEILPPGVAEVVASDNVLPIPTVFLKNFQTDPVKALRDLAGRPPLAMDPFISLASRIMDCETRWYARNPDMPPPVDEHLFAPKLHDELRPADSLRRVIHIDVAYSSAKRSDALGMAMGHVAELVDLGGEVKPYIVFDFLMRMKAPPGKEIIMSDVRQYIYDLRERGYKISQVTVDGVAGIDFIQTLNRNKIMCEYLSVDRTKAAYEDLKDAIYERRVDFPRYMTQLSYARQEKVIDIAYQELSQLEDKGRKIDHPPATGSKDVADAMAAVIHVLGGSPIFRRGLRRAYRAEQASEVIDYAEYVDGGTKRYTPGQLGQVVDSPMSMDIETPVEQLLKGGNPHNLPMLGPILMRPR